MRAAELEGPAADNIGEAGVSNLQGDVAFFGGQLLAYHLMCPKRSREPLLGACPFTAAAHKLAACTPTFQRLRLACPDKPPLCVPIMQPGVQPEDSIWLLQRC